MKNIKFNISRFSINLNPEIFSAMFSVKAGKPLYAHLIRMTHIVVGSINSNWVRLTVLLFKAQYHIYRSQGLYGLVKYQKVCCVGIQQVIGGHKEADLTSLGPRISRTKGGLPRILPVGIRDRIRSGDVVAMKWALTMLSLYRVITIDTKPKFKTITDPRVGSLQMEHRLLRYIQPFWSRFAPGLPIPLEAPDPFPMTTSSPNSESTFGQISTHPASILRSRIALMEHPHIVNALGTMMKILPHSPAFFNAWL